MLEATPTVQEVTPSQEKNPPSFQSLAISKSEKKDLKNMPGKIGRRRIEQTGGAAATIVSYQKDKSRNSPAKEYRHRENALFPKKEALGAGIVLKLKVAGQEHPDFCLCHNFRGISFGPNGSRFEPPKKDGKEPGVLREPIDTALLESTEEFFSLLPLSKKALSNSRVMEISVSKNKQPDYYRTVYEYVHTLKSDSEKELFLKQLNFAAKHINPLFLEAQKVLAQSDMEAVRQFIAETTAKMQAAILPGTEESLYEKDHVLRASLEGFQNAVQAAGPLPLDKAAIAAVINDTFGKSTQYSGFDIISAPRLQLMTKLALELVRATDFTQLSKEEDGVTVQVKREKDTQKIEGFIAKDENGKSYKFGKFFLFDVLGCFPDLLRSCALAPEITTPKVVTPPPLPPASYVASSLVGAITQPRTEVTQPSTGVKPPTLS